MLLHDLRRTTKNENERMRKQTDDCLHLPLQVSADTEEVAFAETDRQTEAEEEDAQPDTVFCEQDKKEPNEFSFMYIFFWGDFGHWP